MNFGYGQNKFGQYGGQQSQGFQQGNLSGQQQPMMVGGFGAPSNDLPADIDQFARSQRPEISMAQVVQVQRQVVSGTNYRITYRTPKGETYLAVVYDQPWTKKRQLTSFEKMNIVD